ncbi:SDR family NAD(P)-dependent oxidoreductase [Saccharopolyspora dendranthemae]|uniref:NAD(P)-dependent dehydrogenase (Short-subunit alcohol dehydrogenase family) n=1 Tax=Saccharopolyspora dendranthemae TaxID=1181886 RepID=A0A561V7K3_9PSEU|nr:SDR family oxidoreductase [Saccharopolyspora dendranthemae]TWG07594.1 NAD(P)-dependent dehydrogenase (short-subunit alcohol dehydrogenase family) [Saccharopolyspora dendranthemae]
MSSSAICLITGGSRGLGRATALKLAESGVDVIITYRSGKDEATSVVEAVEALGRRAVALHLETTDFGAFAAFAASVRRELETRWGRDTFDFLVNNAGSTIRTPVGETTEEAFDLMVNVHLKGTFFLTQALLPLLADGGRIVNVSTALTRIVNETVSVYAAVKSAVDTYSLYLAKELGSRRISVNTVAPGPVATDFGGGAIRDNAEFREVIAGQAALGRVGEPEDIAGAIVALLQPGSGWITAQRIEVSGGMRL